jgi:hypothetical protein
MNEGCLERVFDAENEHENRLIWEQYGSELAGDFGTKLCGKPVVWGGRCEEHKVERRTGKDRRGTHRGPNTHS